MPDNHLKDLIDVAAGRRPADLVLKNGHIVNVLSNEIHDGDIAIHRDRIAGIGSYEGRQTIDLKGRYACPGFIDAHVHIESSLMAVPEFARVVVAHGTTAVVADPHEFANVMGIEGISFVLRTAKYAPIDVFVTLSSCVPASPYESAASELTAEDLAPMLGNPWVVGLAEMMNYPGIINGDDACLEKVRVTAGRVIDGHAPTVTGKNLNAYIAAGIMSDHECTTPDEAIEKLRRGLHIMIREGSQTRNLATLIGLVNPGNAHRFLFCTDDKDVCDLLHEGQLDFMVRKAVSLGCDPILAVRMASQSTARYFRLYDRGAIAPSYRADIAILDNLEDCNVTQVFRRGMLVAESGRCIAVNGPPQTGSQLRSSINLRELTLKDFEVAAPASATRSASPKIHVIHVMENRVDTEHLIDTATVVEGHLVADPKRDLAKLVAIERHHASGQIGHAFARGFGLKAGAIASSVAHDAHNLIVVGMNDADMLAATQRLAQLHGGVVVVRDGKVLAEMPLPIAGLVSDAPAEEIAARLKELSKAGKTLDCPLMQPFMALAFLSLSVIGKLKLTTKGLVDVEKFEIIPLAAAS